MKKEQEHEWNIVEYDSSFYGGYVQKTTNTKNYLDGRQSENNEYSILMPKIKYDGSLYAYRFMYTKYPKLRANGISPISLVDVVDYDYETKIIKNFSTGLINIINSNSLSSGVIVLRLNNTGFDDSDLLKPPQQWGDFKKWVKDTKPRSDIQPSGSWKELLSMDYKQNPLYRVIIREMYWPWRMVQGYLLEDAYLTVVKIIGANGQSYSFRGTTCGSDDSRKKMCLSFIDSIIDALEL